MSAGASWEGLLQPLGRRRSSRPGWHALCALLVPPVPSHSRRLHAHAAPRREIGQYGVLIAKAPACRRSWWRRPVYGNRATLVHARPNKLPCASFTMRVCACFPLFPSPARVNSAHTTDSRSAPLGTLKTYAATAMYTDRRGRPSSESREHRGACPVRLSGEAWPVPHTPRSARLSRLRTLSSCSA